MINIQRLGSWISEEGEVIAPDPTNLYRYVGNSPTNFTDPSGLAAVHVEPVICAVSSASLGQATRLTQEMDRDFATAEGARRRIQMHRETAPWVLGVPAAIYGGVIAGAYGPSVVRWIGSRLPWIGGGTAAAQIARLEAQAERYADDILDAIIAGDFARMRGLTAALRELLELIRELRGW